MFFNCFNVQMTKCMELKKLFLQIWLFQSIRATVPPRRQDIRLVVTIPKVYEQLLMRTGVTSNSFTNTEVIQRYTHRKVQRHQKVYRFTITTVVPNIDTAEQTPITTRAFNENLVTLCRLRCHHGDQFSQERYDNKTISGHNYTLY